MHSKYLFFSFFCLCPFLFFRNVPEVPIHIGVTAPIHFSSACGQINSKSLITYWVHRKQICRSLDQRMCVWPPKLKLTTYKSSLPLVCEEYCNDWCVRFNVKISLHHLFSCFPFATAGSLSLSTVLKIRQVWSIHTVFAPLASNCSLRLISQHLLAVRSSS